MKIEVNITKNRFLFIMLGIFLISGGIFVYAYNPSGTGGNPSVFGHDASELGAGRFSNQTASDQWIFPGIVKIESLGFDGGGSRGVFVDSEGNLFSDALPGPESELSLVDEFIGGPNLGWDFGEGAHKFSTVRILPSEMNRPGIISYTEKMSLNDSLYSTQFFDVSFIVKANFKSGFDSASIGLYKDSNTRIAFDVYETGYTARDNWLTVTESGGVQTITKTSVPISTSSWVKLRIIRKSVSEIEFYVNDNLVATHSSNIPDSSMSVGTFNHDFYSVSADSFRFVINDMNKRSLTCSQIHDSGSSNVALSPGFASLSVPSACMASSGGCVIKQEIYASTGLKLTRLYSYKQESNGKWTGSYYFGRTYTNGDTSSVNIIPSYHDSRILLRDDYSTNEVSSSTWTIRDASTGYAQKLYSCTYS